MTRYLIFTITLLSLTLMQCKSSSQEQAKQVKNIKFEPKDDITSGNVYFTEQVLENKEDETVISIFFPELTIRHNYKIDKVYFRNRVGEIINGKASSFASLTIPKKDIIMSNETNAEYGNSIPNSPENISFNLKDNVCVVTYLNGSETKYYKIENVVEKPN